MPYCVYCSEIYPGPRQTYFCWSCLSALHRDERQTVQSVASSSLTSRVYQVHSAYLYRGIARSCILAYKARGHQQVGMALVHHLLKQSALLSLLISSDAVMPAPSSLWSRLHGRLDLAYLLADALSKQGLKPLLEPPRQLSWRWAKQTWLRRSERGRIFAGREHSYHQDILRHLMPKSPRKRPCLLIVDDVVTTGNTLTDLGDRFRNIDLLFFTLASAYQPKGLTSEALKDAIC